MDDAETLLRRARLRELVEHCFGGKQAALVRHIEARTGKRPNQGEISLLMKDHSPAKSFGDKKARRLCEQIGLSRRWFEMPLGSALQRHEWDLVQDAEPLAAPDLQGAAMELWEKYRSAPDDVRQLVDAALNLNRPTVERRDELRQAIDVALMVARSFSGKAPKRKAG